jgi:hypothetical protein
MGTSSSARNMGTSPKTGRQTRANRFVVKGGVLPPSAQVLHFGPPQWEEFVEAAVRLRPLDAAGSKYAFVKRLGGPNDKGRDIEARLVPNREAGRWDLYQGKHYGSPLAPTNFFPELAKFFKHLLAGSYVPPRQYLICAPRGVGSDLFDLLADPAVFKQRFIEDWKAGATGLKALVADFTPAQLALVQAYDFSTIVECQLRDILEWHELDRVAHHALFGIVPERMDDPAAPAVPTKDEENYIQALLEVYSEFSGNLLTLDDLLKSTDFAEHFHDQRTSFYCAEGLKTFSRDLYGEHEFVRLLDMVHAGVRSSVNSPKHTNGLDRLEAGLTNSQTLKVNDSVLAPRLRPGDLPGTCHHLANAKRLKWVK